jgi:hypothetical protein
VETVDGKIGMMGKKGEEILLRAQSDGIGIAQEGQRNLRCPVGDDGLRSGYPEKWALLGSNQRPPDYESGALTD